MTGTSCARVYTGSQSAMPSVCRMSSARDTFECTGMADGGAHGQPAGTWSDDTSMALCICSSIKQFAHINVADIAGRFRRWLERGDFTCDGRAFDVGVTCERAILTGVPAKHVLRRRYGYIASRPVEAVKSGKAVIDQCI